MAKAGNTDISRLVSYAAFFVGALCFVGLIFTVLHRLLPMLQVLVPGFVGWWFWQRQRTAEKRRQRKLHATFYRLLQQHQGRMMLLDFAMMAELSAIAARHYLDSRAQEFAARFEVTEQGDVVYVFSTLQFSRSPDRSLQAASPIAESATIASKNLVVQYSLTQAELAKRLGVTAKTISRKKHLPTLTDWTQSQDPDRIAWSYAAQTQRFFPSGEAGLLILPETDRNG